MRMIVREEAKAFDHEIRSMCVSMREEAQVFDCEIRRVREEARVLLYELLI
jgi:hypothetical protein